MGITTVRRGTRNDSTQGEARRVLLSEGAIAVGTGWADDWCARMRLEGRLVAGGWPGTLSEARARAKSYLDLELARRSLPLLTQDELVAATRTAYARARRVWLDAQLATRKRKRRRAAAADS